MNTLMTRKSATLALAGSLAVALALSAAAPPAGAQTEEETQRGLERYRQMLREDPWSNPALLDADRGELLWTTAAGPRNATLEDCDLGLGPGIVDGAFARLPRYFEDAGRVMDVETRILWCMRELQGVDVAAYVAKPHPSGGQPVKDVGAIATWIANRSEGEAFAPALDDAAGRRTVAMGEALFNRRSGPFDFSCATCHSATGQRIRLQELPHLSQPEEARVVVGEWPAYRVSSTHVMTMQHRMYDCYWQMRMPQLEMGSEASVALIAYLVDKAAGGDVAAPGIKR
ncbi:sulfur oxidation c-type cytochrome SoxA [Salinarimonas sp. NSM]|uniref:sulfur oxidation c-type cytochrome SoxA n=1 Tax=Salinarimonas sp. NSM TaxID=3458003 RepID=UPI00403641FE